MLLALQYRLCASLGLSASRSSYISSTDEARLELLDVEKSKGSKRKENLPMAH